jgi:hypothetical protein
MTSAGTICPGRNLAARVAGCKSHFARAEGLALLSRGNRPFAPFPKFQGEWTGLCTPTPHVGWLGSSRRRPASPQGRDVDVMSALVLPRRSSHDPGPAPELTFTGSHRFRFLSSDRTCRWLAEAIATAREGGQLTIGVRVIEG